MSELTQEYLKSILHYNPDTGIFTWKERDEILEPKNKGRNSWNAKFAGKEAGGVDKDGYIQIMINKKPRRAHRLAFLYMTGNYPLHDTDHINGTKTDNRICNLREATRSENNQNQVKARKDNKSTGLLGAYANKRDGTYVSTICVNNKSKHLGTFKTAMEAHTAYIDAKREIHPFGVL